MKSMEYPSQSGKRPAKEVMSAPNIDPPKVQAVPTPPSDEHCQTRADEGFKTFKTYWDPDLDGITHAIKGVLEEWEDSQRYASEPFRLEDVLDTIEMWLVERRQIAEAVDRVHAHTSGYSNPCAD